MQIKDKDIMREWFADMPDESLPSRFQEKIMEKVRQEALLREKRHKRWGIFGYVSGVAVMIGVCVSILYSLGMTYDISEISSFTKSFDMPEIAWPKWDYLQPDSSVFHSHSFLLSVFVGILALFLLFADSLIRRHIEKMKHPK